MYRSDLYYLKPGTLVMIDDLAHADVVALREFLGESIAPALAGPWEFIERTTSSGKAAAAGASLRLRSGEHELVLHHRVVRLGERPALRVVTVADAPATAATSTHVDPPRCDVARRAPWKDNRKIGALYLDAEPGGTVRVALVAPQADGTTRCEAEMKGLAPHEVERIAAMFVARIAARVSAEDTSAARAAKE